MDKYSGASVPFDDVQPPDGELVHLKLADAHPRNGDPADDESPDRDHTDRDHTDRQPATAPAPSAAAPTETAPCRWADTIRRSRTT